MNRRSFLAALPAACGLPGALAAQAAPPVGMGANLVAVGPDYEFHGWTVYGDDDGVGPDAAPRYKLRVYFARVGLTVPGLTDAAFDDLTDVLWHVQAGRAYAPAGYYEWPGFTNYRPLVWTADDLHRAFLEDLSLNRLVHRLADAADAARPAFRAALRAAWGGDPLGRLVVKVLAWHDRERGQPLRPALDRLNRFLFKE